jgi:hypothetical protein
MLRHFVADARVAEDEFRDRYRPERGEVRHVDGEDDAPPLAAVGVAELHLNPAGDGDGGVLVEDPEHLDRRSGPDLERDVLRDDRGQPFELLREDRRRRVGVAA